MKYCSICGTETDPSTGLCPKCDKFPSHTKRMGKSLIIIPIALLLVFTIIFSSLVICGIPNLLSGDGNDNITKVSDDMYVTTPNPENMQLDSETGIVYIDNEVLITFKQDAGSSSIDYVIDEINGKIIGEISATNTYQIQIENSESFKDLERTINSIEKYDAVDFAGPNLIMVNETTALYPESDTVWKDEWDNDIPNGPNWGVEAINAPEAWEYVDETQEVNVGVFDNMFLEHEDLEYKDILFNTDDTSPSDYEHGTHVAGTIGAGFDNGTGISGIAPKSNIYAWSFIKASDLLDKRYKELQGSSSSTNDEEDSDSIYVNTLANFKLSVTYFIAMEKCKVINFSVSDEDYICYAASQGNTVAIDYINYCSKQLEEYLLVLLHNNFDFNLVVSAGNTYNMHFTEDKKSVFGYKKTVNIFAPTAGTKSKYINYLNNIDNEELKSRIIVVGAVKNTSSKKKESFELCDFSNRDERVDILAPGEKIQSTVSKNKYAYKSGTSMAAPHVSGIAAMLYSLDPTLTGAEVKSIICNSATKEIGGIKLADAAAAVKKISSTTNTKIQTTTVPKNNTPQKTENTNFVNNKYLVEINNTVYGVDQNGLWKNEGGVTKEYLTECAATNIATNGQVIYYTVANEKAFNSSSGYQKGKYDLYEYDLTTKSNKKIMTFNDCGVPICAVGDTIYYTDHEDSFEGNMVMSHGLCSYNTTTKEKAYLCDSATVVTSCNGKIFYRDLMGAMPSPNTHQIYCYNTATKTSNMISEGGVMNFKVISGKVYYDRYIQNPQSKHTFQLCSYDVSSGTTKTLFETQDYSYPKIKAYDENYVVYSETRADGDGYIILNYNTKEENLVPPSTFSGDFPSYAMRDSNRTIFYSQYKAGRVYTLDDDSHVIDSTTSKYEWATFLTLKGDCAYSVTKDSENYYSYYISCGPIS